MKNSFRSKSIDNLLKTYYSEPDHAKQVKKISLLVFDKTFGVLHKFSEEEREYLAAGALLHDIGYYVSKEKHNKHSYNLIIQSKPEGYSSDEVEIIANIARYHRGKKPKKSHENFMNLPDDKTRKAVKKLSSIVRMADGLDRSHLCIVKNLDCSLDSFSRVLYITIETNIPDCGPEIWAAEKKKDLFEKAFDVSIIFRVK